MPYILSLSPNVCLTEVYNTFEGLDSVESVKQITLAYKFHYESHNLVSANITKFKREVSAVWRKSTNHKL